MNKLYTDLRKRGLEVLLINFREDPELVKRTVRERGYVATVLIDQSGDVTGRVYGVWGPPTAYFVDRRGQLVGRVAGPRDWSTLEARRFIQALLDAGANPRGTHQER
ncbi:MAG: TlpA family protein disulfide reductase [Candidatus Rokubacteria bacterium]|nr:TlpA family protein disulfide reductase [Candidatus Rokubacteria bacterium]